jgi:hypothetical protein
MAKNSVYRQCAIKESTGEGWNQNGAMTGRKATMDQGLSPRITLHPSKNRYREKTYTDEPYGIHQD